MTFERDMILNIRNRIDAYDDMASFVGDEAESIESVTSSTLLRVQLGSRKRSTQVSIYAKKLQEELGLHTMTFIDTLTKFFQDRGVDVHGNDFEGDGFIGHQVDLRVCRVGHSILYHTQSFDIF
jgi:hypothetical protein